MQTQVLPPKSSFSNLSEDVILDIIHKLEPDPRDCASFACVSTKISSLVRNAFWKNKCLQTIPTIVSDLIISSATTSSGHPAPPGGWASLYKISVCCPGLVFAGFFLEKSDYFGFERELVGSADESYRHSTPIDHLNHQNCSSSTAASDTVTSDSTGNDTRWSLFDDLYFDTLHDNSESLHETTVVENQQAVEEMNNVEQEQPSTVEIMEQCSASIGTHLATNVWDLSREQGSKLLGSRFRGDCLYICGWPGCVHKQENKTYMIFRGIFKNFRKSMVWRTINDHGNDTSKTPLYCAFCSCKQTWDLQSAFCLRMGFGYHEDGEPVVRAFVCENGHVSGAWTDVRHI
ncbi:hypothetical protein MKW94_006599 [Papaver nudicaule]|uniref:F-box domain-containing protein n=1 Tax=Papaver nudicaule TaxID=74823 RepID=A0AA41VEV9_PAPNU|nr:hypothetical protein [Papaver nudicaule]